MKLKEDFFSRKAEIVARDLLGKNLCRKKGRKILRAAIVETEAYYGENDPASRACRNGDLRETMLSKPGTILVYGVHNNWLINFVTGKEGRAEAVLLRALEPLNFKAKTNGPGLLTKAFSIDKKLHKQNVSSHKFLWIEKNRNKKIKIIKSFRIGVSKDLKKKLRFYIKGNRFVSRK